MKTATGQLPYNDTSFPRGRFAPSPSGRMHLGNIFTALISWLSVKAKGGKWILRIEDLDPQRSKTAFAQLIEDDLTWLGLQWDEGGLADNGPFGPYSQSKRTHIYQTMLDRLVRKGLVYPCHCRRADILATQAPHRSDGRIVYNGHCRPQRLGGTAPDDTPTENTALRLYVPDKQITFTDIVYGPQKSELTHDCGDFIVRRADGAWAYQLAVVTDDALMGITEVVRGNDLLLSTAQQIHLATTLGFPIPAYAHLPLICNSDRQRLSKRDMSMSMEHLRRRHTPQTLIGTLAAMAGIIPEPQPISPTELIPLFRWPAPTDIITLPPGR